MLKTRITQLLGIEYPIMQGGMQWLGEPVLAAAVSEAGGLGTVNTSIYPDTEEFRRALRQLRVHTSKPFCVNISMLPGQTDMDKVHAYIDISAEEGAKAVETAGMSPEKLVPHLKKAGLLLIHKVPSVKHALSAERVGSDIVTVVGIEAGGHPGRDEVAGAILVNRAAAQLKIPVLMAGSIADGAGLAAALALGAEGAVMATRFIASRECWISQVHKEWILSHDETDTVLCQRSIQNPIRVGNNAQAKRVLAAEAQGADLASLMELISGRVGLKCYQNGEVDGSLFPLGCSLGLIHDIRTCREIIEDTVAGAEGAISRLNTMRG